MPSQGRILTPEQIALSEARKKKKAEAAAKAVAAALAEGAGDLLEDVHVFDDYRGAGIDEGKKSLAFALRFRATDRTLTTDEASAARSSGVAVAADRFGAVQR